MVDATIIIGLLILLTFQSISSSFIENESSEFIKNWYNAQIELATIEELLFYCDTIVYDYSEEINEDIAQNCVELEFKLIETSQHLLTLDMWGFDFYYLEQYDEDDNTYSALNGDFYDPELVIGESDYLRNIVTGPLWINLTNLIMIFPFLVSAVIASFNTLRNTEESGYASKAAVISMGAGFATVIVGLAIIVIGFFTVYAPFID